MNEQWQELKETIIEMRDNNGALTQQEVCKFLANLMDVLEKQMSGSENQGNWIPCSERLPEEPYGCLVTVWDTNPVTMDEFENILPYFVGWDGEQWNDGDGEQCPFEVVAWMPLPVPARMKTMTPIDAEKCDFYADNEIIKLEKELEEEYKESDAER